MRQISLNIEPHLDAQISDFEGPGWKPVIDTARQMHLGLLNRFYLYGEAGTGKSHILTAICESYLDMQRSAIKVSLLDLLDAPIDAITSLENYDLVALDDIETISGVIHWQRAIFHLINSSGEGGGQLIFSSRLAPTELRFELPDLQSRLTQAVSLKVPDGSNIADRTALVEAVLKRRGLIFDAQIVEYLIHHGPHKSAALLKTVDQLDALLHGDRRKLANSTRRQIFALIDEYNKTI
ncbi:MAG: DnaA regulatory inactivator Hda [Moraxellaceae bacterium]|nr:MAG: DnaA regulatory inactivator Hda [Moraxellaceae bacterium]